MKIAICVPCFHVVRTGFAKSLADLMAATAGAAIRYNGAITKPQIITLFAEHGPLTVKREQLAVEALRRGMEYVLWIDSDQTFPADGLLRLAKHDLPIVGCNYPMRTFPLVPTAVDKHGKPVMTTAEKAKAGRVEQVGAIGLGFCLVKAQVFSALGRPLFKIRLREDGSVDTGEDVYFCNQARKAGIAVHVDHGLSWQIGHIGDRAFYNSDIGEVSSADSVPPASGTQ